MSKDGDKMMASLFVEIDSVRRDAAEADNKADAGIEGLERQGDKHALLEEVPAVPIEVTGDANVAETTQLSVEVSAANPAVAQLYDFDGPASYTLGENDLFLVRSVSAGVTTLRYVAAPEELPSGGSEYQVLQRNGAGAAVWDWVHYVVPSS